MFELSVDQQDEMNLCRGEGRDGEFKAVGNEGLLSEEIHAGYSKDKSTGVNERNVWAVKDVKGEGMWRFYENVWKENENVGERSPVAAKMREETDMESDKDGK